MAGGVEYQVTKVDPTDPETKGMVYQVHKVSEEVAATLGGKVYRARIINDPTDPTVAGKVYQIVLIGDPDDPAVKGKVYNAILTGGSEVVIVGPAVSPLVLPDAIANSLSYVKAFGGTELRKLPSGYTQVAYIYFLANSYLTTGINPSYDGRYEFDFQTTTLGSNGATTYLGVRPSSSGNGGLRVARISTQVFRVYGFGAYHNSTITAASNTRYKFVWDNQHAVMTSGGSTVLDLTYTDTDACAYPITINGWNSAGTVTPGSEGIFVYSFKAWNAQGELVADYVPTKDPDGVVGFYDTVSKTFKTATAGTFAAGGEAVPTPDAPMDIVSNNGVLKVSPNLYNATANPIEQGAISSATGNSSYSDARVRTNGYIPCKPNTTYRISCVINNYTAGASRGIYIFEYSDSEYIGSNGWNNTQSRSFTTGANTTRLRFVFASSATGDITPSDISNVQLELGSTATTYMPYGTIYTDGTVETIEDTIGNTAVAEMLLKVDDYQDEQEILSGAVTRNVGVLVLDGTEAWSSTGDSYGAAIRQSDYGYLDNVPVLCSHFPYSSSSSSSQTDVICNRSGAFGLRILADSTIIPDNSTGALKVAGIKAFLAAQYAAGTPVIVVYPLATATTESVTGQTLQVQAGDNVLEITQASIDGLRLEAEYEKEA